MHQKTKNTSLNEATKQCALMMKKMCQASKYIILKTIRIPLKILVPFPEIFPKFKILHLLRDRSFVYKVLVYLFGYGKNLIWWIKILNINFRASILQSGFLSEQFDIHRGCCQGDPVSPFCFSYVLRFLPFLFNKSVILKVLLLMVKSTKYPNMQTIHVPSLMVFLTLFTLPLIQ